MSKKANTTELTPEQAMELIRKRMRWSQQFVEELIDSVNPVLDIIKRIKK